jgi:plasmid maintenance system antidote protein VapI
VAPVRTLGSTQRIISALLKVSALITAAVTVGYLVVNMGTTSDIWVPLGVVAIGLSLSLIQWRLSEPF